MAHTQDDCFLRECNTGGCVMARNSERNQNTLRCLNGHSSFTHAIVRSRAIYLLRYQEQKTTGVNIIKISNAIINDSVNNLDVRDIFAYQSHEV
jgi:hypothetical protein